MSTPRIPATYRRVSGCLDKAQIRAASGSAPFFSRRDLFKITLQQFFESDHDALAVAIAVAQTVVVLDEFTGLMVDWLSLMGALPSRLFQVR